MAPDLKAVAAGENFDYSQPGSSGYSINQDLVCNDPNNRKLRVLTIGAGMSSILMAYRIQKDTPNVEHVVYEKNQDTHYPEEAGLSRYRHLAGEQILRSKLYFCALVTFHPTPTSTSLH